MSNSKLEQSASSPSLRVTSVTARPVLLPMRLALHTASGAIDKAPLILIDIGTDQGIVGRSYLFAIAPRNFRPIASLVDAMAELIIDETVAPYVIERKLRQHYALLGVHNVVLFAMSGIDMALWDALAQSFDQPLVKVLGGAPRPIPAYNSKGLGIMPAEKAGHEAVELVKEGFDAVKMRLGRDRAADDMDAIRAVRTAIGPDIILMCDFNQGLNVNEAIRRGEMIDDEGTMTWIEEPVRADNFAGTQKIADAVRTPIQIGENFMGAEQMAQALSFNCCDFVMPDVQRIGGVTGWLRAAALADAAGIDMSSHLFPEISAHLLAVTPTCHYLEYVDWVNPVLRDPIAIEQSCAVIPDRPGCGIVWDEPAVKRYTP